MTSGRPPPSWWRRLTSARVEVQEGSMRPTLQPGDRLLVDREAYRDRAPEPGDIVLLEDPERAGVALLKRVAPAPAGIPPGTCWVLGDAAAVSRDSRQFGPVGRERVRGRAFFRYAPRAREGYLDR